MKISVSCLGARQHYAVPRALHKIGALEAFYTDIWSGKRWDWGGRIGNRYIQKYAARYHPDLRDAKIQRVWQAGLSTMAGILPKNSSGSRYYYFMKQGIKFASLVKAWLQKKSLSSDQNCFFGFTNTSLETLRYLHELEVFTILDQIDPAGTEAQIMAEERDRWPGWDLDEGPIPEAYFNRVAEEWATASLVLVNSQWTKNALVEQGLSPKKIVVIPQAYEGPIENRDSDYRGQRPLRVLWLGSVILRKGIPYLIQAAKQFRNEIEIQVVGWIGITKAKLRSAPKNMKFVGPVPRTQINRYYRWADIFVLPTISDGFATTQLEAMSFGVPVIATPRCGEVVTDGVDGTLIPPQDTTALVQAIEMMVKTPDLVRDFSRNCLKKAAQFSLHHYGRRLTSAMLNFQEISTKSSQVSVVPRGA